MKLGFLILLLSMGTFAADDTKGWNVLAKTISCQQEVTIEAKEGEKYVYALHHGKRRRLQEQESRILSKHRKETLTYLPDNVNGHWELGDATFTFVLPASVMSNPPSITVFLSGVSFKCPMAYKD